MKLTIIHGASIFAIAFSIYWTVFSSLSFNWYVPITFYKAHDVCVGDDIVTYTTERIPRWGIPGETWAQIIRIDNGLVRETTNYRGSISNPISFTYEEGTTGSTYDTRWEQPFTTSGTYGANEWLTIYPLPFIEITKFNDGRENTFNVVECNV